MFDLAKEFQHNGMIDWLSLAVDASLLPDEFVDALNLDRVMRVTPDGDIKWEISAWDSVRSDSHQISCKLGSLFQLQGSPARVGFKNNVFGSLDIVYCAEKMITFIAEHFGFKRDDLPPIERWNCTRIDVTRNYFMQSEAEARQAILALKQMPSGTQKVSYEENGVYIGKRSRRTTAKIYLKGQDAKRLVRTKKAFYTEEELKLTQHLLRFELSIKSHTIRELKKIIPKYHFKKFTPRFLLKTHEDYFNQYISQVEVANMGSLLDTLLDIAPTEGQAKAAYDFYLKIRQIGYEQAKASATTRTFYRHRKLLRSAGLSLSDLTKSNVLPIRTKPIILGGAVHSWQDIKQRVEALELVA